MSPLPQQGDVWRVVCAQVLQGQPIGQLQLQVHSLSVIYKNKLWQFHFNNTARVGLSYRGPFRLCRCYYSAHLESQKLMLFYSRFGD